MNNFNCESSRVVIGNSVDIDMKNTHVCGSDEIRSDIMVEEFNAKRIWGQVVNCNGFPVANCLVKLVKTVCDQDRQRYMGVAHTVTNCEGFYQFDICADDYSCYKIIVNKSSTGGEVILDNRGGNCNACRPGYNDYNQEYRATYIDNSPCNNRCNCSNGFDGNMQYNRGNSQMCYDNQPQGGCNTPMYYDNQPHGGCNSPMYYDNGCNSPMYYDNQPQGNCSNGPSCYDNQGQFNRCNTPNFSNPCNVPSNNSCNSNKCRPQVPYNPRGKKNTMCVNKSSICR